MASSKQRKLIQTTISVRVFRLFDEKAKAAGHTRAGYLRFLVNLHVLPPKKVPVSR